MKIEVDEKFTITFTGKELAKIKKYLASGHSYHINTAQDMETSDRADLTDFHKRLAAEHRADAEEILKICKELPNPHTRV